MIDAIDDDYVEFKTMIYGEHPHHYWSGLLNEADFLAIAHFKSLGRWVNFKLTLLVLSFMGTNTVNVCTWALQSQSF